MCCSSGGAHLSLISCHSQCLSGFSLYNLHSLVLQNADDPVSHLYVSRQVISLFFSPKVPKVLKLLLHSNFGYQAIKSERNPSSEIPWLFSVITGPLLIAVSYQNCCEESANTSVHLSFFQSIPLSKVLWL